MTNKSSKRIKRTPTCASKPSHATARIKMVKPQQSTSGILDAVRDQLGERWIQYGTSEESCWFSISELLTQEKEVLSRLAKAGTTLLGSGKKNRFRKEIEQRVEFRSALVAERPGWLENHYVFGDGTWQSPRGDRREIIIAFEIDLKFTPVGQLDDWQKPVGKVIAHQPLPQFAICYALVGAILRFAPIHIPNPQAVIVGPRESGKSSLNVLAASLSSGNLNSGVGGCETWDMTTNTIDRLKVGHADGFLGIDEMNLAGLSQKDQRDVIGKSVFKVAGTGTRQRFKKDDQRHHVRCAILSTSNLPLGQLFHADASVASAQQSRVISIVVPENSPHGVLAFVPSGFASAREAVEYLHEQVSGTYGAPMRAFVKRLVRETVKNEQALQAYIANRIECFLKACKEDGLAQGSARIQKIAAITYAAGCLARKWGIFRKEWGMYRKSFLNICRLSGLPSDPCNPEAALQRLRRYVEENRRKIVSVARLDTPLSKKDFEACSGFLRANDGHQEILVPSSTFRRSFPDHKQIMRLLRDAGYAQTERGKKPKLTIKTPHKIYEGGRVYCIRLGHVSGPL